MRGAGQRAKKYREKVASQGPGPAHAGRVAGYARSAEDRRKIEALVSQLDVPAQQRFFYTAFAEQVQKIARRHSRETAASEACIARQAWSTRGLQEGLLDQIISYLLPGTTCIVMACDYPPVEKVDKGTVYDYGAKTGTLDRGLPWTGQTLSYAANDDGAYQKGHTTDRPIPGARFTDNGDGTVTDNATGLMWEKVPSAANKTFAEALLYAEAQTTGGHTDWRLPNINELLSILDYSRISPVLDTAFFTKATSGYCVSSTTNAVTTTKYWAVYETYGYNTVLLKTVGKNVRCVRLGKP